MEQGRPILSNEPLSKERKMALKQTDRPTQEPDLATLKASMKSPIPAGLAPELASDDRNETSQTGQFEGSKRRMPENLTRYLLKVQGGKLYLPAAYRIVGFPDE